MIRLLRQYLILAVPKLSLQQLNHVTIMCVRLMLGVFLSMELVRLVADQELKLEE